jgi:6-phosphogluconate dehydrogenase
MQLAMVGLGRMGGNMARRLKRGGIDVVGFNRSFEVTEQLAAEEGIVPAKSLREAIGMLESPRVVWLMVPAGGPTEQQLESVMPLLSPGDVIVDGGNSNYQDSVHRGAMVAQHDLQFVDCGTSGGVWGLDNGYCLMLGGESAAIEILRPALEVLAPAKDRGWAHVGPVGAGHYTKMIHNGIEYGMMQALAEGLDLLKAKEPFGLDLAQITELWRHGSVVRSWLLDLTAEALAADQDLGDIAPVVADSGEGRWTVKEAVDLGVPAPVISLALAMRFASQDSEGYGLRSLAVMRRAFGGHAVSSKR